MSVGFAGTGESGLFAVRGFAPRPAVRWPVTRNTGSTPKKKDPMKFKVPVLVLTVLIVIPASVVLNPGAMLAQNQQSTQTVMDYMREGSAFYLKNDFKNAIGAYSKALELEKKQSRLEKTLRYVLVDNLGIS